MTIVVPEEGSGKWISAAVHRGIRESNLGNVVFQDPFSEVARRAKRNALAASFVTLTVSGLHLQVTGFLSLQASGAISADVIQGVCFLLVAYFLLTFITDAYVDLSAWKFKQERLEASAYLGLIEVIESHGRALGEQIGSVLPLFQSLDRKSPAEMTLRSIEGQLGAIDRHWIELRAELKPLLKVWEAKIRGTGILKARLRVRLVGLVVLDIAFPIFLSSAALLVTWRHAGTMATILGGLILNP